MAETSGFFNAEVLADGSYDRTYAAEQFAKYFSKFIGNGIFVTPASQLKVIPKTGELAILVQAGSGYINGYWYDNSSTVSKQLQIASGTQSRIDRVVLRWSVLNRDITLDILTGSPSSAPSAPSVTRDANVYELALADIVVGVGVTEVKEANITDLRNNNSLCGYVAGVVSQIDATNLFSQFTAAFNDWFADLKKQSDERYDSFDKLLDQYANEFDTWFDEVKGKLSGDVAASLQNQVDALGEEVKMIPFAYGHNNFVTDLLRVDHDNPLGESNKFSVISTEDASTLANSPIASGAFYAYREIMLVDSQVGNKAKIIVVVFEAYPQDGRIWINSFNPDSQKWSDWQIIANLKDIAGLEDKLSKLNGDVGSLQVYYQSTKASDISDFINKKIQIMMSKSKDGLYVDRGIYDGSYYAITIGNVVGNEIIGTAVIGDVFYHWRKPYSASKAIVFALAKQTDLDALKKSVSDGKSSIASAITNNGVATASDATFAVMVKNIGTACTNKYNAGHSAGYTDGYNEAAASASGPFGFGQSASYFATPIKTHKMGTSDNSFVIQEAGSYRCCAAAYGGNFNVALVINGVTKFNTSRTLDAYVDLNVGDNVYMRTIGDSSGVCQIAGSIWKA